jgi:hypothetical protein
MTIHVDTEQRSDNGQLKNTITRFASRMEAPAEKVGADEKAPWK